MSKRDELVKAQEAKKSVTEKPVSTAEPATAKPVAAKPATTNLTSAELYAEARRIADKAEALVREHDELMHHAESLMKQAVEAEAREAEAKAKAKAEAETRAKAKAAAEAAAKARVTDGSDYTGPVYIPGWSDSGRIRIGSRFDGE